MRRLLAAVASLVVAVAWSGGDAHAAEPRVYVVTEAHHFVHPSIAAARAALARLGRTRDTYDVTLLPDAAALSPARLRRAAAVVFALTDGELRVGPRWKRRLLAYVRGGGGFVAIHSAANTLSSWPAWRAMLGARFVRHPAFGPGTVRVVDRAHPATRTLPATFTTSDEFYVFDRRPDAHVLLRTGAGAPLAWTRREGRGHVFYDALGHADAAWSDPRFLAQVDGGIESVLRPGA